MRAPGSLLLSDQRSSQRQAWRDADLDNPHAVADKASRVQAMFSAIAPSYDLNNRVHSLWRDQAWRRAAVKAAELRPGESVLDVACGTGDLTLAFKEAGAGSVVGVDFTFDMLRVACRKSERIAGETGRSAPAGGQPVDSASLPFLTGDAMRLPLADAAFDVASIAFGIRNVGDPARAMREFFRVLRSGGRLIVLEFSLPTNPLMRTLYNAYFHHVLPRTASLIARDKSGAYKYLPRSVNTFVGREVMQQMMSDAGFREVTARPLTMGVAVIYRGIKP